MELKIILSIVAIIVAILVWFNARVFISSHIIKYNKYLHISDFKLLKELTNHDDSDISDSAKKHHRNVKITALVIITAVLVLISQRVN